MKFARLLMMSLFVMPFLFQFSPAQAESLAPCDLTFTQAGLCARVRWINGPSDRIENRMQMQFVDLQTGSVALPAPNLKVVLWMPDMGHGSRPVSIENPGEGLYQVNKMYFVMPGHWEVRVTLGDGQEQQVLPVDL